jgi:hypothetical protein
MFSKYNDLALFPFVPTSSDVNYLWTKSLRQSFAISEDQEVHTVPYKWHKGLQLDAFAELELFRKLGISKAKKGLAHRRKILSSLLLAFVSCCVAMSTSKPIIGILFPASTSGGKAKGQSFCAGAAYSAKSVSSQLAKLAAGGWIKKYGGFRGQGQNTGVTTLWTPTEKLVTCLTELVAKFRKVTHLHSGGNIVLKEPVKDRSERLHGRVVSKMSNELTKAQKVLQSSVWTYKLGTQMHPLQPVELELTRAFKYDYKSGGRVYCSAQNLPKLARRELQVNGNATVELDFKCLHPTMLYHLGGFDAPTDCYMIPNVQRDIAKQVLLIALNAESRTSAKRALAKKLKIKFDEIERIMAYCEEAHEQVRHHLYSNAWRRLQYIDSRITMDILNELAKEDIPVLPVHDSYVVEAKYHQMLKSAMGKAYKTIIGRPAAGIEIA